MRELVRYRAKLVAIRSGLKKQVHAVLAKAGVLVAASDRLASTLALSVKICGCDRIFPAL